MKWLALLMLCLAGCQCQPPPGGDGGVDAGEEMDAGSLTFAIASFGEVLRGDAVERTGTFTSSLAEAVEVSSLTVTGEFFTLVGPGTLQVPAGGTATTTIRFAPSTLGPHAAQLTFLAAGATRGTALSGTALGPSLELLPMTSIELGSLPLYDGFPTTARSALTVHNVGRDGVPPRADTALQVFFDVQSTTAPVGELCVGDCSGSPLSVPVGAVTVVPLQLTALTEGIKSWQVRAFSNDPDAPIRTVVVNAEVVARPTCQFAVPAQLAFGVLTSPEQRELEVIFENVGTEFCDVASVTIGPESPVQVPAMYSVANGPITDRFLPGQLLRVLVRALPLSAPTMPTTVSAELRIAINHPDGFARVPLTANLEPTCLRVTPSPLDFGSVQTTCRSADRPVSLENTCARSVIVTSATLPGFSSFSVSAALPRTLAQNETVALTARYAPFAVGPERSVIDVTWQDGAATKHTTVPLLGEANTTGENVELYPPRPRSEQGAFFPLRGTPDPLGAVSVSVQGVDVAQTADGGVVWAYDATANGVRFSAPHVPIAAAPVSIRYSVACAP